MKSKKILTALSIIGVASMAYASTKIAEYNDPITGNTPGCSFVVVYGTGYGNTYYTKTRVTCPGHVVDVERTKTNNVCQFNTTSPLYSVSANNCDNWRVYLN